MINFSINRSITHHVSTTHDNSVIVTASLPACHLPTCLPAERPDRSAARAYGDAQPEPDQPSTNQAETTIHIGESW
jgi:hypothetical protein